MLDAEDERRFTKAQLDEMPVRRSGLELQGYVDAAGAALAVDLLDGGWVWIQYARKERVYRCAAKSVAAEYEHAFRAAK